MRSAAPIALIASLALGVPCAGAADGWAFALKDPHVYVWDLRQETAFDSAGDHLAYVATLRWKFVLMATETAPDRARLGLTILAVKAAFDGPGSHHEIDTEHPTSAGERDPLLGTLGALRGAGLVLTIDPRSGAVSAVEGAEKIAATVAAREPSPLGPGEPSPLEAQARAAYSPEALARLWSQVLAAPGGTEQQIALGAPLAGAMVRRWKGTDYTLALPGGVDHLDLALGHEPLTVGGRLTDLVGDGSVTPRGGIPVAAQGSLGFTLTLTALTQPVVERQTITWHLAEAPLTP